MICEDKMCLTHIGQAEGEERRSHQLEEERMQEAPTEYDRWLAQRST